MRLFLAIELPEDVRHHLIQVQNALKDALPKLSYTKGENLHLTLKFLGEVDPRRIEKLTESLGRIRPPGRIELTTEQIECFPSRGPIRIMTAALTGTIAPLRALHQAIEQRCRFLEFDKEQRVFRPHVTLGRARPVLPSRFRREAEEVTATLWPGPTFSVSEFVLMESKLNPSGATYITAARFAL